VARSRLGTLPGEKLSNVLALLNALLNEPFDVNLEDDVITIEASVKQLYESNGEDSVQTSFKRKAPPFVGLEVETEESTIDFTNGVTTGSFSESPFISPILTGDWYIRMGIELREDDLKWHLVWGDEAELAADATFPRFSAARAYPRLEILLQNNGAIGQWNFITPVKQDVWLLEGNISTSFGSGTHSKAYALTFNGTETEKEVDTTVEAINSRKSFAQLVDENFRTIDEGVVVSRPDSQTFKIETTVPLPSGGYRLLVYEAFVGQGSKYYDLNFSGLETTKDKDISADFEDAQKCMAELLDASNEYRSVEGVLTTRPDQDTIHIETSVPLDPGIYRLLVKEVE